MSSHPPVAPHELAQASAVLARAGWVVVAPSVRRWMTVRDVATTLSVGQSTVRRWIRDGLLPGATLLPGGDLRVPAGDVDALAQRGLIRRARREQEVMG